MQKYYRVGAGVRKRIRQIARGKFEYEAPLLLLPEEELSVNAVEGQEVTGSFEIVSSNHIPVRGVVYSTNSRMECLTPQFEGDEIVIRYQFHTRGLREGAVEKGCFVIVCNQSEHSLSFCVSVSRLYADSSIGKICNLDDFTALAKENWNEAYRLFYHNSFKNIFHSDELKNALLYRGITGAKPYQQNMEEFLIGLHKKKRVSISLDTSELKYDSVTENLQHTIEIQKDEWGYVEIDISTDADFIRLYERKIATDDFIGNTYLCKVLLEYGRMHAGNNYGRIIFSTVYGKKIIEISAHKGETGQKKNKSERMEIKECRAGLMELYQAYRLKKIVTGVWANETIEILNHLHAMAEGEPFYLLMKAQTLLINRQRQEAEWILEEFKRDFTDHHSPMWGYYLYIMTLMEREPSYVDRMTYEIEMIFHENPDSPFLFWILLFLKEEYYNNSAHKLKAIEYWVMRGNTSPYFYLEAYYLILQDPYLLTELSPFAMRILRWAIRHQALTKDVADQIFQVINVNEKFSRIHYQLLEAAYEVNPEPENVGVICSYLIRSQKFSEEYHLWFEKGIEAELRLTNLYEAFLLSMDERKLDVVPKIIQIYFQYESKLPYRKMAILYSNIIASKESSPEIYRQYRQAMGRFAMEQVEQKHMDDNLAVLYEDMLELGLVNEEIAHCLSGILFTHKLVLFDARMVRAIIYQKQMKDPQIVPVVGQAAYFQLYSDEYVVLFEDEKGRRYISGVSFRMDRLMNPLKYLDKCMELAPDELPYMISHFEKKTDYHLYESEDERFFPYILKSEELYQDYQNSIALQILRYYQTNQTPEYVLEYLRRADFEIMSDEVRRYMIEQLVDYHMYDKAYQLIRIYGLDQLCAAAKVTLASYLIQQEEESEQDDELLLLCTDSFVHKKYNDTMLRYLCDYYNGPTGSMYQLWCAAKEFELNTFELEERILVQMIYSDGDLLKLEGLFAHYYENGGRELVILAYISACAHAYFVEEKTVSRDVFLLIKNRCKNRQDLNDACRLALLKYFSDFPVVDEEDLQLEDVLLAEYTCRNMNFAFYKKLDKRLIYKYHLYDKMFLEYRTDPRKNVRIHYCRDEKEDGFIDEDMPDVYDGIFVEQFVLFFGESVQYYITEEYKNQVEVKESSRLISNDVYSQKDESRYNLINQMLISDTLSDEKSLYRNMKQYVGFDEVTRKEFKLL